MGTLAICMPVGAIGSSVALATDILGSGAEIAADQADRQADRVLVVSTDGKSVRCRAGLRIDADAALDDVGSCSLVWVAAYATPLRAGAAQNATLIPWLVRRHEEGALIAAHGPSTFLLAEAGLLRGRIATAYRPQAAEFRRAHPDVDLRPERSITDAGGVYCCVGVDSAADLLVTLVGKLYGRAVATSISAWALVDSQRSYQVAMSAFDGQRYHGDDEILEVQSWLEENFGRPITVAEVATLFAMSTRTLVRRFKAATGEPPGGYLARVRVEAAKDLLRSTNLTIAEVAARVGYRDVGAFYDVFAKLAGCRPREFRAPHQV